MKSTFIRSADFELRDDGRTLTGRIVPYNEISHVVEFDDEKKQMISYDEQFLPHSLAAMSQAFNARGGRMPGTAQFVPLLIDHNDAFDNMVGHAVELRDEDDGAYASFRLYDDSRIQKIRSVLSESHTGLSIAFRDIREPKLINDVVSRVQVYIGHVAATPTPQYTGAMITGMRTLAAIGENGPELVMPIRSKLADVRSWLNEQRKTASE